MVSYRHIRHIKCQSFVVDTVVTIVAGWRVTPNGKESLEFEYICDWADDDDHDEWGLLYCIYAPPVDYNKFTNFAIFRCVCLFIRFSFAFFVLVVNSRLSTPNGAKQETSFNKSYTHRETSFNAKVPPHNLLHRFDSGECWWNGMGGSFHL